MLTLKNSLDLNLINQFVSRIKMSLKDIKRRLLKYQRDTMQTRGITPAVADIIREGRYYDELTPQEQDEVIAYYNTDRDTFETVYGGLFNDCSLHFQVEKRTPAPRTKAEQEAANKELIAYFDEIQREYNSPEAQAQRETEYRELQRLGELRKQDYLSGWDMDKEHPLPGAGEDRKRRERWERFDQERRKP